jgi:hypothetical protein
VKPLTDVGEVQVTTLLKRLRLDMQDSGAPPPFWAYAAQHACHVMNSTRGPPGSSMTSHEALLGRPPKVMKILPFGCRVYTISPDHAKTGFAEPRSWRAINLGCNHAMVGGYDAWSPATGRVVHTSELYFDESLMPWRPAGTQQLPPLLPDPTSPTASRSPSPAPHSSLPALMSRTLLLMHHGKHTRPDGLRNHLERLGFASVIIDNGTQRGDVDYNIADDSFFQSLLVRASSGEFLAVVSLPASATWAGSSAQHGRTCAHPSGTTDRPISYLGIRSDTILARSAAVISAASMAGSQYLLSAPADRGDARFPRLFLDESHVAMLDAPAVVALRNGTGGTDIVIAKCMHGGAAQDYTAMLVSPGLEPRLH